MVLNTALLNVWTLFKKGITLYIQIGLENFSIGVVCYPKCFKMQMKCMHEVYEIER